MKQAYLILLKFCFFFLLFLPFCLKAQPTFKAKVVGQSQEPVPMAVVAVLDANNNEISSAVTDSLGKFAISMPADVQNKWLYVQAFGYVALREPLQTALHRTVFEIVPDALMLQDVTIQSNQLSVERGASCYTISNIYTSPIAAGNNIVEVLKYAPLVNVSTSGDLEILNKGKATIYVNGRKSNLDPKNIPAENIEKIEVITSPGSEYPSTDRNGILNIVLRKAPGDGVSASIKIRDSQKEKWSLNSPSVEGFISIQKKKVNATIGVSSNYNTSYSKSISHYDYFDDSLSNVYNSVSQSNKLFATLSSMLDWHINDKHTLGFQFGMNLNYPIRSISKTSSQYFRMDQLNSDSSNITTVTMPKADVNYSIFANVNYSIKFNSRQNLFFDLFYTRNQGNMPYQYEYSHYTGLLASESSYRTLNESVVDGLDFKVRYYHNFSKTMILKVGAECYGSNVNDKFSVEDYQGSLLWDMSRQSNFFVYKDITSAVFADFNWDISDMWSLSAGLRGEYYYYEGKQIVNGESVIGKYPNLFPSFAVVFIPNDDHELSLDFTSRQAVPSYGKRNPFKFFYSPTLYRENNPNLLPSKMYDVEFAYTFFWDYMLILGYSYASNLWNEFKVPTVNNTTIITDENYGNAHFLSAELYVDKQLFHDYLMMSVGLSFEYDIYKVTSEKISAYNETGMEVLLDISLNAAICKKKDWRLETRLQYVPKSSYVVATLGDDLLLNANVSKKFHNSTLSFGVDNILDWQGREFLETLNYSFENLRYYFGRTYWIAYTMKFGNKKTNGVQKRSSTIQGRL